MMLNDVQRELILALADNDLNVSEVARIMHYHRNTIVHHLEKIRKQTGLDPTSFSGMERLLWRLGDEDAQKVLKPCPYCGSKAVVDVKYIAQSGYRASVRCTGCPVGLVAPKHKKKVEAEEYAIAVWNRRVTYERKTD